MVFYKGGKEPLAASDVVGVINAHAVHEALLQPSQKTHGDEWLVQWVVSSLSLFEFGLPLDPMQKAYRVDAWVDEVGKYPFWALERVTTYLRQATKLPSLGEVITDLEMVKRPVASRLSALKQVYGQIAESRQQGQTFCDKQKTTTMLKRPVESHYETDV